MYKNASEEKLLKQINLSDLTAVAYLKDPKGRRDHTFGLFSSSRNYHFQAASEKDARSWVELIRYESRIDEEEESMVFASPIAKRNTYQGLGQSMRSSEEQWERERLGSSSPEPLDNPKASTTRDGVRIPGIRKLSGHELDYSGAEHGSYSDFSDTAPTRAHETSGVASSTSAIRYASAANTVASQSTPMRPPTGRNTSQSNNLKVEVDDERVIWHGYLLCLKSKGGVRQWKKLWVVLRPKNLAFYKNEEVYPYGPHSSQALRFVQEYSAHLLIPLSCIINAIEIDPISRSKSHCFQIIAEEKTYRFCAPSEESLARCLGALKSQLAKRKEKKEMIIRKSG